MLITTRAFLPGLFTTTRIFVAKSSRTPLNRWEGLSKKLCPSLWVAVPACPSVYSQRIHIASHAEHRAIWRKVPLQLHAQGLALSVERSKRSKMTTVMSYPDMQDLL
eukprot:6264255-Amphidinium_carterae.1